jgi:transposase
VPSFPASMARKKTAPKGKKPASTTATASAKPGSKTYSGTTTEVVAELIDDGDKVGVLKVIERLELEIKKLQLDLAKAKDSRGRHSEGVTREQLGLLFDELAALREQGERSSARDEQDSTDDTLQKLAALDAEAKVKAKNPPKPPSRPMRREYSPSLLRVDNVLAVPCDQHTCPSCQQPLVQLEPEVTEVLDYKPGALFVRRDIREVFGCRANDCAVVRGPLGDKVIPGGAYGSSLVAEIVIKKYRDGMSLHRVTEWLQRMGYGMPSASLSDQVLWATELLTPIWRALLDEVTRSAVMQLDGTGMPVHHKEKGKPQVVASGTLWGAIGDGRAAVYTYASTAHKRGQREPDIGPEDILAMRAGGFVVVDADNKFDASFKRSDLFECGCAMHSRRYFVKALDAGNQRAVHPIAAFKKIYYLEGVSLEAGLSAEDLVLARDATQRPVWEGLRVWCTSVMEHGPPSSLLVVAARYLLKHYDALTRYLSDGRIPIDNGLTERLFRRIAIVRKNALFVGSHDGGRRAAVIFSILATCELLGINPAMYLADILPTLARGLSIEVDLPPLMPAAWIDAHPEARVPRMNVQLVTEFA